MGIVGGFAQAGFEFLKERSKHEKAKDLQGERLTSAEEIARKDRANRLEIANKRLEEHKLTAAAAARAAGLARDKYEGQSTFKISKLMGYENGEPQYKIFELDKDKFSSIMHMEKGDKRELATLEALYNTPQMNVYDKDEEGVRLFGEHWGSIVSKLLKSKTTQTDKTTWTSLAEDIPWLQSHIAPRIYLRDQLAKKGLSIHRMWVRGKPQKQGVTDTRDPLTLRMHRKFLSDYNYTPSGELWTQAIAAETPMEYIRKATNPPNPAQEPSKNIDVMSMSVTDIVSDGRQIPTRQGNSLGFERKPFKFESTKEGAEYVKFMNANASLISGLGEHANYLYDSSYTLPDPTSFVVTIGMGTRSLIVSTSSFLTALLGGEKDENSKLKALELANEGLAGAKSENSKSYWSSLVKEMSKEGFFTALTKAKAYQITSGYSVARGNDTGGKLSGDDYKFSKDSITGVTKKETIELLNIKRMSSLREYHIARLMAAGKGTLDHAYISSIITSYSDRELLAYSPYNPDRKFAARMLTKGQDYLHGGNYSYLRKPSPSGKPNKVDPQKADKGAMPPAPPPPTRATGKN